ncbi:MAG: DUF892 family protein [Paludibacter sp.]|nr:DUF892 family protein [Paludibacter sp.]
MKNSDTKFGTTPKGVKVKSDLPSGLRELFVDKLKDIYRTEKEIAQTMPKMIENASCDQLVEVFSNHLEQTQLRVMRLEEVFSTIGEKDVAKKSETMAGLNEKAEEIMKENEFDYERHAAIITNAKKVEHYEIESYVTLASFARILGEEQAAYLLEETLIEDKVANDMLSKYTIL